MGFGELVIILFVIGLILAPIGAGIWVVYAMIAARSRGKEEAKIETDAVRAGVSLDDIAELRRRLDEAESQLRNEADKD
jgi:hypothetical protein